VESPTPVTKGCRGGSGEGARGGCGGTRRRAVSKAGARGGCGGTHHPAVSGAGAGERYDDDDGRRSDASRTLEELEAALLQFEVSSTFPVRP
jgi:hypothetical protein